MHAAAGVNRAVDAMRRRALGLGIPDPRLHANAHADTARQLPCICSPAAQAAAARARRLDTQDRLLLFTSELETVAPILLARVCTQLYAAEAAALFGSMKVPMVLPLRSHEILWQGASRSGDRVGVGTRWRQHAIWA